MTAYLINDVECELDKHHFVVGDLNPPMTEEGERQSVVIAKALSSLEVDVVYRSPSLRTQKIYHQLSISRPIAHYHAALQLQERSFGVYNGTNIPFNSDLFTYSRVTAEEGESVQQCSTRLSGFLDHVLKDKRTILLISHPFACQIIYNQFMNQSITKLQDFWMMKGSMISFDPRKRTVFERRNLLLDVSYGPDSSVFSTNG